jgi:hypothetical protein
MQLNVPPDLEALIKNAFRAAAIRVLKTYSAALLKRRTPKKAGATRNAVPCALMSRKAIYRPSAENSSTADTYAILTCKLGNQFQQQELVVLEVCATY